MLHTIPTLPRILMYEEVVSTAWSDCPWRRKIIGVLPPPLEVRQLLHELVHNWVSPPPLPTAKFVNFRQNLLQKNIKNFEFTLKQKWHKETRVLFEILAPNQ